MSTEVDKGKVLGLLNGAGNRDSGIESLQESRRLLVLIPIHSEERMPSLIRLLQSLSLQNTSTPFHVLIADNGLNASSRDIIASEAERLGLSMGIVDAHPNSPNEQNAAHARNLALRSVVNRQGDNPEFRAPRIVLIDSDVIPSDNYLSEMDIDSTMVIVSGKIIPVNSLSEVDSVLGLGEKQAGLVYKPHVDDLLVLLAFGSDVVAKTNATSYPRDILLSRDSPFLVFPSGSGEDMMLSFAASRRGERFAIATGARVADINRGEYVARLRQQANWALDHVVMYQTIGELGFALPGIRILERDVRGKLASWTLPESDEKGIYGALTNPEEIKLVLSEIERRLEIGELNSMISLLNIDPLSLASSIEKLKNLLALVDLHRDSVPKRKFDFPINNNSVNQVDDFQTVRLLACMSTGQPVYILRQH